MGQTHPPSGLIHHERTFQVSALASVERLDERLECAELVGPIPCTYEQFGSCASDVEREHEIQPAAVPAGISAAYARQNGYGEPFSN